MSNITFQETGTSVHSSVCTLSGANLKSVSNMSVGCETAKKIKFYCCRQRHLI